MAVYRFCCCCCRCCGCCCRRACATHLLHCTSHVSLSVSRCNWLYSPDEYQVPGGRRALSHRGCSLYPDETHRRDGYPFPTNCPFNLGFAGLPLLVTCAFLSENMSRCKRQMRLRTLRCSWHLIKRATLPVRILWWCAANQAIAAGSKHSRTHLHCLCVAGRWAYGDGTVVKLRSSVGRCRQLQCDSVLACT